MAGQQSLHYLLLNLRCCGAFEEPADEGYPQTVKKVSPQSEPYTESYEKETDETSGVGRNQSCSPEIARNTPHNRAKNPSAVQRESGNEIKEGKHGIDESQVFGGSQ